jgi:signal transduction histidine kinase
VRLNPGYAVKAPRSREAVRYLAARASAGLVQVLAGRDTLVDWHWPAQGGRRAAIAALGSATVALCVVNVASLHGLAPARMSAGSVPLQPVAVHSLTLWQLTAAVLAVAPFPLAVRYPLLAWRIGWLALLLVPLESAHWWGGWPWGPPQILAMLVALCVAGMRNGRPALWWMWALTLVPWALWLHADVADKNGPVSATVALTAVVIATDSVGLRLTAERDLAAQAERTRAERAQRAVLEERTRIARELHDVVAHHMSLIAVQAETAPYRITGMSPTASAEFGSLSATARDALAEMRRLLGVLRQDEPAGLAPQPQLCDVPTLVDAARRVGVLVELAAPAAFAEVPSAVGVCAYRIVQECLSNASQHAPGAPIAVSVSHERNAVLLRVANGPAVPPGHSYRARGSGHGLTGMRERVELLGGSLSAGPASDGGFVVSAVLPVGESV